MPLNSVSFETAALLAVSSNELLSTVGSFAMPVAIVLVAYLLLIRPMHKQENERKERLAALDVGAKVVLTGGLLGRISKIDGAVATVELADRVKVRVLKKEIADTQENALAAEEKDKGKDPAPEAKDGKSGKDGK